MKAKVFGIHKLMIFVAIFLFVGSIELATSAPIVWKLQIAFPGPLWEGEIGKLAKMIKDNTNGRLIIKPHPAGAILKAPKILEGVSQGVVEAGGTAGVYYTGKIPEMAFMHGIPFLYQNVEQKIENVYDYRNGELFKLIKEAFREQGKVIYLCYGLTSSNGLFGNFPVSSLGDFKGRKIRSTGLASKLLKLLGASPVYLPGAEHYTAFQRGTIDGTIYPFRSIKDYKLFEVVKYMIFPPFYPGTEFEIICNIETYEALPDDLKLILDKTCVDWARNVLTKDLQRIDREYLAWIQKVGVKKIILSRNDVNKLKQLTIQKVLPSYVNKTPRCKKMWSIIEAYAREKGLLR